MPPGGACVSRLAFTRSNLFRLDPVAWRTLASFHYPMNTFCSQTGGQCDSFVKDSKEKLSMHALIDFYCTAIFAQKTASGMSVLVGRHVGNI